MGAKMCATRTKYKFTTYSQVALATVSPGQAARARTGCEEERAHAPHAEGERGQEEHEEVQVDAGREVVLVAVLHGCAPCDVDVAVVRARVLPAHEVNLQTG
jgi:hypothetical protein